jgi:hypothetical protein
MVLLPWGQLLPLFSSYSHVLLLLRRQLIEPSLIFGQAVLFLRRLIPQTLLHIRRWRGGRLLPVGTLRTIVPGAPAIVIRRVLIPTLTIIVRAAAVRIRRLPIRIPATR